MQTGVYRIVNLVNGKSYVGSTARSFARRFTEHKHFLKSGKHQTITLQRAWNKYGEDFFIFQIIETCEPELCLKSEQFWMDFLNPEYNICRVAYSSLGTKSSPETRAKISKALKKHCESPEARARLKSISKLANISPEIKAKFGKWNLGKKRTDATKEKLRQAKLGKRLSEEHKLKLSQAALGYKHTPEARARMSEAAKLREAKKKAAS